ncbi:zinc ABC transporter substrate-binding protein [Thermococcus sp.]|uniref:metal ABC transporter solute-binding protein, Zn/Mn family n=1 Tax=Thermococcus sp. TaxID=35749 RepID=UPI0026326B9D|nr:zinc ABC transporter substrate-binding protein [Thermococcus sp.]
MKKGGLLAIILLVALLSPPATSAASTKPLVVATIAPLAGIVKDAFGDSVQVVYLIPPGIDPHEYQLTAKQIALLQRADVIVTTDGHLPVEKKIAELQAEGTIKGKALFADDYAREGFRYLTERWYTGKDNPHGVWLDPTNALAIAKATEKALEEIDPANANIYAMEYNNFQERVNAIVKAYRALVGHNKTAVIQMPPDQYAIEWLGIKAVAAIKPEEEAPAVGVDNLLPEAANSSLIVYGVDSPDQLKKAAFELAEKSGKPIAGIIVFGTDEPYTKLLIKNTAAILEAITGKGPIEKPVQGPNVGTYVIVSLVVGLVLGTAIGVVLKK